VSAGAENRRIEGLTALFFRSLLAFEAGHISGFHQTRRSQTRVLVGLQSNLRFVVFRFAKATPKAFGP